MVLENNTWSVWQAWARGSNSMRELIALEESDAFGRYPELKALIGCPQDSKWHPEGDVWVHTKLVVAEALIEADVSGRPPLPKRRPAQSWLEVAKEL